MGGCFAKEEEESEEARRARAVGMTLVDNMSLTSEELNELARREAMTPIKIDCQTDQGKVPPRACGIFFDLPIFSFCFIPPLH